jgi:hypothetical protein
MWDLVQAAAAWERKGRGGAQNRRGGGGKGDDLPRFCFYRGKSAKEDIPELCVRVPPAAYSTM